MYAGEAHHTLLTSPDPPPPSSREPLAEWRTLADQLNLRWRHHVPGTIPISGDSAINSHGHIARPDSARLAH
ncbi:unnamed protein product, partial [Iphiclides podalirius]